MQELITYIIISVAVGYVGFKTVAMFKKKPICEEECPTCSGCHLKESCSISKVNVK